MELARAFATFALETDEREIPEEDLAAVERSCFDTIGTILAGSGSPPGTRVEQYVRAQHEPEAATILGSGFRASAPSAALANGSFAHADDYDDTGAYGHPSCVLVPALLAAAELRGAVSGREFVTAFAVGFEVGRNLHHEGRYAPYEMCFHSAPVFGAVAAAAGASRLLGLSERETTAAIGIAASEAGGLGRNGGTMVKPLHAGNAASSAILAILLATEGVEAAADVFEAQSGFNQAFFQHRATRADAVVAALGKPFHLASSLAVKQFPNCGANISALNSVATIMREEHLSYDDIERVSIRQMSETSAVLRCVEVERPLHGKFSVSFTVGSYILKGGLTIDDYTEEEVHRPEVKEAVAKVDFQVLPRWDKSHDRRALGNPVRIRTTDGRQFERALTRAEMIGSPKNPVPTEIIVQKFRDNAARALASPQQVDEVARAWRHACELTDVRDGIAAATAGSLAQSGSGR